MTGRKLRLHRELVLKLNLTVGLCVANTRTRGKIGLMWPLIQKLPPLIWWLSISFVPTQFPLEISDLIPKAPVGPSVIKNSPLHDLAASPVSPKNNHEEVPERRYPTQEGRPPERLTYYHLNDWLSNNFLLLGRIIEQISLYSFFWCHLYNRVLGLQHLT